MSSIRTAEVVVSLDSFLLGLRSGDKPRLDRHQLHPVEVKHQFIRLDEAGDNLLVGFHSFELVQL